MITKPSYLMRGTVLLLAFASAATLNSGCDRKDDASTDGEVAPGRVAGVFEPPTADTSVLTPALRERIESLRETIAESPRNPDNVGMLGTMYLVQGFAEPAVVCFERAAALSPDSAHWRYYLGLACERARDFKSAGKAYGKAIERDSAYPPFYIRLARLLVDSDPDRGAILCRRALELDPRNATALVTLGLVSARKGDLEGGAEQVNEALAIIPNYREGHQALAVIYGKMQREEDARRHAAAARAGVTPIVKDPLFETLLRNGYSLDALLADVGVLIERGALPEAENAYERAVEADRGGRATTLALARLRTAQGRYAEAAEAYRRAIADKPDAVGLRMGLAEALALDGKDDEAEQAYKAVLERALDNPLVLDQYGRFLMSRDRDAEAEELLRAAVERNAESANLRYQLGGFLADMEKDEAAREQLEECLKLAPGHPAALWILGVLSQRAGDQQAARQRWEAVLESSPVFMQAHVSLARAALAEHDHAEAVRRLRKAREALPGEPGLANTLAWLLATCPDDSIRDGKEAIKLAEGACRVTQNKTHTYLDTLAAAYGEAGRFDDAVRTLKKAIELAKAAGDDSADYEQRLKLFEEQKPFREPE